MAKETVTAAQKKKRYGFSGKALKKHLFMKNA